MHGDSHLVETHRTKKNSSCVRWIPARHSSRAATGWARRFMVQESKVDESAQRRWLVDDPGPEGLAEQKSNHGRPGPWHAWRDSLHLDMFVARRPPGSLASLGGT